MSIKITMDLKTKAINLHKRHQGKLKVASKIPLRNLKDLSLVYTPGVGAVSSLIAKNKKLVRDLTFKRNSVAVVSDGSAVLGLGNIGPEAALAVMEGKAVIFKEFADIDAIPIVLNTQDSEKIIEIVKAISPTFGGINLEDISAPRCFEIEERLKKELDIPVMHDDQHGTAIVVLAALVNAARVVKKKFSNLKVVISGVGPAGAATAKLLLKASIKNIIIIDSKGIISTKRQDLLPYKKELVKITNPKKLSGDCNKAIENADVFIGLSRPNVLLSSDVKKMAKSAIVFAMANPIPEIMPDVAKKAGAAIVATGRSDFPNQINNALVFPGVFRGALDHQVRQITDKMKMKAAYALAGLIKKPNPNKIVPSIFDKRLVKTVAKVIR
ncbi:NAD-dependent malic enzyme [Candidatus Wolfebacteria bacterium CG18_big_fil_WC_8_21_14_2_50_39_7]|uniref:NAD-dependent malic enzyme n=4 Tax=Candidatus Wolfeibacteriota TaxID=1752735 RepID=A0A2M7Q719_9BACT|nr:NADP-dependent malic enzyme [Parcubacteria group bacterium]NCP58569.1 NADP-dependent malic enzyme [Candidatus Wolfebacteria bacterium]OIO64551.1 MAG: NAD-dependent malic enzyme [Candidatus Wolfebacteria bacterium CG1_02_39_135]PIP92037.1 MAG: NAD-dependent malic enzyme [Candidatus Wolfebacteria bacterium CG18_big_fil_WC_8_21_14_2_50_39_7]PIY59216.1 MAG: NAD-dependent malic enzyme [Candidatus Wolfebacteria bacterium CG_4_10_14_0_8_um_filter_39_64]PJB83543.1 MAG: NAD-dependent malic enzyme [C